jgi:hypothetical protein
MLVSWQVMNILEKTIKLPDGTRMGVFAALDNSTNLHPIDRVRLGTFYGD